MENFNIVSGLKRYKIAYEKITSMEDFVSLLKGLDIRFTHLEGNIPEDFKEIIKKGLVVEIGEETTYERKN